MGLFQKKFWKNSEENSEKINRGDPYLKKTYLGGPKEKFEKKKIEKNYFQFFFQIFLSFYFFSMILNNRHALLHSVHYVVLRDGRYDASNGSCSNKF